MFTNWFSLVSFHWFISPLFPGLQAWWLGSAWTCVGENVFKVCNVVLHQFYSWYRTWSFKAASFFFFFLCSGVHFSWIVRNISAFIIHSLDDFSIYCPPCRYWLEFINSLRSWEKWGMLLPGSAKPGGTEWYSALLGFEVPGKCWMLPIKEKLIFLIEIVKFLLKL